MKKTQTTASLTALCAYLQPRQARIVQQLDKHLPPAPIGPQLPGTLALENAMRYAVLSGGKRLRPLWVYATGEAFGTVLSRLDKAACAVEYIHAYSLVHDDLPAMDNDTLRRGQPTCHVRFGEATALLAGNALQTLAFSLLNAASPAIRRCLIQACDHQHLIGGQALDLSPLPPACHTKKQINWDLLTDIHARKTGALITASITLGYLTAQAPQHTQTLSLPPPLAQYAHHMGRLFQLQDDLFDRLTSAPAPACRTHANALYHSSTQSAQTHLHALKTAAYQALQDCEQICTDSTPLRHITDWVTQRTN